MNKLVTLAVALLTPLTALRAADATERWPAEKANAWYAAQPWLVGFNYIPATSINTTEMWQADTFDPKTIDQELALAQGVGFNCTRVFIQYIVWESDPKGLKKRLDQFLALAEKHGIRTIFVLFDDCNYGGKDPFPGRQPDVIPGEYANGWTPSPGPKRVNDRAAWPKLEQYVKEIVGAFANDKRVLAWETYNEPRRSLPLVEAAFQWAREAKPTQPVTTTVWGTAEMRKRIIELSDVLSFHDYTTKGLEKQIKHLLAAGRPLLCTEWLNRPGGSVPAVCLPILLGNHVAAMHWGLVNGKTQTQFPWGSKAGASEPKVWQHDIFRNDHTPYDEKELEVFKDYIRLAPQVTPPIAGQWTPAQAWAWDKRQPWLVGCNFLPSTAVNDVEMWQAESFDTATIERELGWAHDLGFNTVRVFLNYVVWESDADGLKKRFDQFLAIADKQGIRVMPILFDDCFKPEPRVGRQKEPVSGVHNSQWVRSPGIRRVSDKAAWPMLEKYVKDMVGAFGQDRRVVIWDLYNEPAKTSLPLVEATFRWAREVRPTQPLASCFIAEPFSDLVNLHNYDSLNSLKQSVAIAQKSGRPVIVTEWMGQTRDSRFETHLPFLKEGKIGCWNWGLVAGRTQANIPWGSKPTPGATEPPLWFHDILRKDGTPYSEPEAAAIRSFTGVSQTPPAPTP